MSVKWPDASGKKLLDLKVRALYVDTRLKEYTTGTTHEMTDRLFAVRRVFRVNDALPGESAAHWQWQRGGWLVVDRVSGKISQLNLPGGLNFRLLYSYQPVLKNRTLATSTVTNAAGAAGLATNRATLL